jgi:hypothetical protein
MELDLGKFEKYVLEDIEQRRLDYNVEKKNAALIHCPKLGKCHLC